MYNFVNDEFKIDFPLPEGLKYIISLIEQEDKGDNNDEGIQL